MMFEHKKGFIFDFDGVIVESVDIKTKAFAFLYKDYDKSIVDKVINHHINNGGMSRFEKIKHYHNKFLNQNISNKELSRLSKIFSNYVVKKVIEAPYLPGVINFIKALQRKHSLFISTGTPTDEIKSILKKRRIEHYFLDVYGSPQLKTSHIKTIIKNYKYELNELIFLEIARPI